MLTRLRSLITRVETLSLVLWFAAAGALWLFLKIGSEVAEGETEALDRTILMALRRPGDPADPIGPHSLEEAMRDVTALGGFTVLTAVVILATVLLLFHGKRRQAAVFAGVAVLAQISSSLLKEVYDRPRPDLVPHGSYVYSASFPSGHSMQAAAIYLTLAMVVASLETRRRTKVLIFVVAGLIVTAVGFSRVYLGVHWPSDVLAGWTLGAAWALAGWIVLRFASNNRAQGPGEAPGELS